MLSRLTAPVHMRRSEDTSQELVFFGVQAQSLVRGHPYLLSHLTGTWCSLCLEAHPTVHASFTFMYRQTHNFHTDEVEQLTEGQCRERVERLTLQPFLSLSFFFLLVQLAF